MRRIKIVLLSIGIFFLQGTVLSTALEIEGKIHKNIYIDNIDVSKLTINEAEDKIESFINNSRELNLTYKGNIYKINLNNFEVNYKIKDSVKEAYEIGRSKNTISNIKTKSKLDLGNKEVIGLKYSYSDEKIDKYILYIKNQIEKEPINAKIRMDNEKLVVEKEEYGISVNEKYLKDKIVNKIDTLKNSSEEIMITKVKPKHVHEELAKINTELGSYETYFNKDNKNRVNNINVASYYTSNVLVNKNEEFSFNRNVQGEEIVSKLKPAPVISNGKVKEGLGGGICQVSSTIYNAALYSGLEITNVRNHTIPSGYIEKGRDATVSRGDTDLRFVNKFDTPILIYNKVYEDRIVSAIYGNKEDKKDIDIETEIIQTIPNNTIVEKTDNLYKGEKNIYENGRIGYKVNTFRVYKDGNEPVKELIHESYYPPMDKVIKYGTKNKINYKVMKF